MLCMIKLFYTPGACSLAAHIMLEETGLPFGLVPISLSSGEQREPSFLAMNPHGKIPVLVSEDAIVTESIAILTWIVLTSGKSELLGSDPLQQARVYECLSFFSGSVHVAYAQIVRPARFSSDPAAQRLIVAGGHEMFRRHIAEIDGMLSARDWFVGHRFTAADLYPLIFYRWARRLEIDTAEFPAWEAHARRMVEMPSVARAFATEGISI